MGLTCPHPHRHTVSTSAPAFGRGRTLSRESYWAHPLRLSYSSSIFSGWLGFLSIQMLTQLPSMPALSSSHIPCEVAALDDPV